MYDVVGCNSCSALWILEAQSDTQTATCPRCRKRHQVSSLRSLATEPAIEGAREARSRLLTARDDREQEATAGYLDVTEQAAEAGMDDAAFLTANDVDATAVADAGERALATKRQRSQREVVLGAIDDASASSREAIVAHAVEHGIAKATAERLLDRFVSDGAVVRDDSGYRRL